MSHERIEIVRRRSAPQGNKGFNNFSAFCGALRWLFIHMETTVSLTPKR